jgi:hypothetical protein
MEETLKNKNFRDQARSLFGNWCGVQPATIRPAVIPSGAWPLEMRSEMAAAYCDEPSVHAFLGKVERNIYSAPVREKGCLPKWHRWKLDCDIARRHGLPFDNVAVREDATDLI